MTAPSAEPPSESPESNPPADAGDFRFPRSLRLTQAREFDAVFKRRLRRDAGPFTVYAAPNDLGRPRLGMAVSRKVGNAVRRHAIKRRLREAFRIHRRRLPGACDYVLVVKPHEPLKPAEYARLLIDAADRLDRRLNRVDPPPDRHAG
jgi:ribonuclease P protein component